MELLNKSPERIDQEERALKALNKPRSNEELIRMYQTARNTKQPYAAIVFGNELLKRGIKEF